MNYWVQGGIFVGDFVAMACGLWYNALVLWGGRKKAKEKGEKMSGRRRSGRTRAILLVAVVCLLATKVSQAKYSGGTGEPNDPYRIGTAEDLNDIGNHVEDFNKCFVMVNDINMAGLSYRTGVIAPDINNANDYFQGTPFTGIFDGNDWNIRKLTIDTAGANNDYLGLFGQIGENGEVKNLGIKSVNITGSNVSDFLGGLCGWNHWFGTISNCTVSGSVASGDNSGFIGGLCGYNERGKISDCRSSCSVGGGSYTSYVGGLCAINYSGTIVNCYAIGPVTVENNSGQVGGLCGGNEGIISNCYASGTVTSCNNTSGIGGLCGITSGNFGICYNCYSTGPVITGDNTTYIGGFCGVNGNTINNSYSTGSVTTGVNPSDIGGFCGRNIEASLTNCYFLDTAGADNGCGTPLTDVQMKQQVNFIGWDFIDENANGTSSFWMIEPNSYPVLLYYDDDFLPYEFEGSGTEDDPYLIYDANDLGAIWQKPDCDFKVINDINLAGINWSAAVVPEFSGSLNGNGRIMSGLSITGGSHIGLIGKVANDAVISNLGLVEVNVTGGAFSDRIGGLCGYGRSCRIMNCYAKGLIEGGQDSWNVGGLCGIAYSAVLDNCYFSGNVRAWYESHHTGGLCGNGNECILRKCYATGTVTGDNFIGGLAGANSSIALNCYSACAVYGTGDYMGGLFGYNSDYVVNCYSTGCVNGSSYYVGGLCGENAYNGSISNCYSVGTVTGSFRVGAFCGDNSAVLNRCYFLDTSGPDNDNGTPLTDIEMKHQSSFVGWDFLDESANGSSENWMIQDSNGYPQLSVYNIDTPVPLQGSGTVADPYLLTSADDLGMVNWYPFDSSFSLISDINLSESDYTTAVIPYFDGRFNGKGHTISDLNISGGNFLGLFGVLGKNVSIENLNLENVSISGENYLGGLAGSNSDLSFVCGGTINNCNISATIVTGDNTKRIGGLVGDKMYGNIMNCQVKATVIGGQYSEDIGGLAGRIWWGTITNCHSNGIVAGDTWSERLGLLAGALRDGQADKCSATGSVCGGDRLGGLVGHAWDSMIENCYSNSSITGNSYTGNLGGTNSGGTMNNCYTSGSVNSVDYAGGLVGGNFGNISNCYSNSSVSGGAWKSYVGGLVGYKGTQASTVNAFWDIETSGQSSSAGGTGLTALEMYDLDSYLSAGWDFAGETANGTEDIWDICEGTNYPRLVWQIGAADFMCPDGVSLVDFAFLAERWGDVCCACTHCDGADLDFSGTVDWGDLKIFCGHWLEGI
ncbi:MAG: GLUG motif-containing protein [Planctomycetota bacterium]